MFVTAHSHWLDDNFDTQYKCLRVRLAPCSHTTDLFDIIQQQ